jgi:AraC-type DNA-binding domain-containing proteins
MLGWSRFPQAQTAGLSPHQHPDAFEICYLLDGSVQWWVGDRRYSVRSGDLFVTRPGESHGGSDAVMHPCELFWVQVRSLMPLPGLSAGETESLLAQLSAIEERRFPASPEVPGHFAALVHEHRVRDAVLSPIAARSALHALLVATARDGAALAAQQNEPRQHPPHASAADAPVAAATAWMEAHLGEPFTVRDVAAAIGLRPQALFEAFERETGHPPGEWRMRRRIAEAERRLRAGDGSVTTIAFALGFRSSQYFATAFKRYTGFRPSDYRAQHRNGEGET